MINFYISIRTICIPSISSIKKKKKKLINMKLPWLLLLALSSSILFYGNIASAKPAKAYCKNYYYWRCYGVPHTCPPGCPDLCQVDCKLCKPYCACDKPGAVCQDPRFIGGDGIMFYFHGKKDKDFCLVSDDGIHINAHFVGKASHRKGRDFTWVQSIAVLFGHHRLFLGANKVAQWNSFVDNMSIQFNGAELSIPPGDGRNWTSPEAGLTITRAAGQNDVVAEVAGLVEVRARAVPITAEESRVHGYDVRDDDCFAHLDLSFKFSSLSASVDGILGQTYAPGYRSGVKIGAAMPIMGGADKFAASQLFATDCAVSRFQFVQKDINSF